MHFHFIRWKCVQNDLCVCVCLLRWGTNIHYFKCKHSKHSALLQYIFIINFWIGVCSRLSVRPTWAEENGDAFCVCVCVSVQGGLIRTVILIYANFRENYRNHSKCFGLTMTWIKLSTFSLPDLTADQLIFFHIAGKIYSESLELRRVSTKNRKINTDYDHWVTTCSWCMCMHVESNVCIVWWKLQEEPNLDKHKCWRKRNIPCYT